MKAWSRVVLALVSAAGCMEVPLTETVSGTVQESSDMGAVQESSDMLTLRFL